MNEIPPDTYLGSDDEDEEDPDARISERHRDRRVAHEAELSDSDEEDAGRRFDDVAFDDDDEDEEEED